MNLATLYPWMKAAHVAAALLFAGGVLAATLFGWSARAGTAGAQTMAFALALRRWDRAVTVPAMLAVWALGLALAASGQWFGQAWLHAKFALVVVLAGLHGIGSGKLRRASEGLPVAPARGARSVLLVCVCGIAVLAVIKPV